ncbi:hypothetical protein H0Z60_14170 [Ectothiorhodospiraceae bacterium WFHF3C12]|nr:hypothetical protein [Ectothiorhodospiraceae bacterium WFHF3C12]
MSIQLYGFIHMLHILGGIFWVGSSVLMAAFLNPTARRLGPEGRRFMQSLQVEAKLPLAANAAALITLLSGAVLFWMASGGFAASWFTTRYGAALTFGSVCALAAFSAGIAVQRPAMAQIARLQVRMPQADENEAAALKSQIAGLQSRMAGAGKAAAALLVVSAAAMALARFV